MTENRTTPVAPQTNNDSEDEFVCPACGEPDLFHRQEVEEGRQYRLIRRDGSSFPKCELTRVDWTIYVESWLECAECGWQVEIDSDEAAAILYE